METNVTGPALRIVKEVWAAKGKMKDDLEKDNLNAIPKLESWIASKLESWIADPWQPITSLDDIDGPEKCHKAIDDWLADFWKKPKEIKASFLDFSNPESTRKSKMHIASLTALSVAGEILSEYRAIFECGIQNHVTFGKYWRHKAEPKDWASHQEKMLSILFHPQDGLNILLK